MITDDQFADWLEDSTAQRVTLYQIGVNSGGSDVTRRLSSRAYIGSPATPYDACVSGGLKVTESISLSAEATLSAGDIEIGNYSGERDSWLDDIWVNQPALAWVGDVRWPESDFRPIFNGIVADIGSRDRNHLNLKLRDKLQRLNTPVTEDKLANDILRPLVFGEVANITPKLKNAATGEYEVHAGAIEDIIEVRTDGAPRVVTKNLSVGSFTFNEAVGGGTITCSVQGDKPAGVYSNTISKLVQRIVTGFGKVSDRYTGGDLDAANLSAFEAAHQQPVGLPPSDRVNLLVACQQLASSVGAQVISSRAGLLRLIQFAIPTTATTEIHPSVQLDRSISIVARTDVAAAVKLGYCRNYTVQESIQTSLPDAHKALFATEWRSVTVSDSAVQEAYKLNVEPVQQDTCLIDEADATAEATRRLNLIKQVRTTYRFEGTPANMLLELGQAVKLFSNRFGLSAGKVGIVSSLSPDWSNFHVTVEVTI